MPAALAVAPPPTESPMIAVIRIWGVIAQHPQSLGLSVDEIGMALDAALASAQVDGILLDIDSPGGSVGGVPELAARILAARERKPIWAIANGLMASAAYWIGSAAADVVVTPSGEVGSIGVYMLHEDWSKNLEQDGIKITAISAGKYKTEGAPWGSLSAETEAVYRQRVDEVYGWFVKAVAMQRKDSQVNVRGGYGQGRVLGATQSVQANLADRVATYDETVARLADRVKRSARRGQSAELLGRRLELDIALDRPPGRS